tara:strand:+ start:489 stop:1529 length:1041 start_codon:yes stop_codon:yes gene_type:complete
MDSNLKADANAVLLPAFASTELSDATKRFLNEGGISILLGETRAEYVDRKVSDKRRLNETPNTFKQVVQEAKSYSESLLVCVDQEIGGICRLHDLVPQFPATADLPTSSTQIIEQTAFEVGRTATEMGVNCFLAPVLDLLSGLNPWLQGRTYSNDPDVVGRVSAAYVHGVQRGGVAATGKHFPGYHKIALDPAIETDAINIEPATSYDPGFEPFRDVIAANIEMIMVGPAIAAAFDDKVAALRSKTVINLLKDNLQFRGLVMADDLDSKATMRGDSVEQVAIDAINAGCDFLLLADIGNQLDNVSNALAKAADSSQISRATLSASARKVRALAQKYQTLIPRTIAE